MNNPTLAFGTHCGFKSFARFAAVTTLLGFLTLDTQTLQGSQAYGSINNFDTVNDTGQECHGFEIELDDIHSTDITYTYDWNHYGTPKITEDNTDPSHPKVFVRYESGKTATGEWSAFTAIPAAPIAPTQGHQFTNPSVNFGGEHFGVGYSGVPTSIKYHWLLDDGFGNLILGPSVNVGTPVFTYIPPLVGVPAKLQAVIVPPEVEQPVREFGHASWVKEIRTSTHNNGDVRLRDLISPDEEFPHVKNWANGEPAEVETEWQIQQKDFNAANGGKNAKLSGAAERLEKGDEVVTRRYEFYAYVGPLDPETGEALCENVAPDGIHGTGIYSQTAVVGKFLGSQMSAAKAKASVGLVDHLQDGEVGVPYPARRVVISGGLPFTSSLVGLLPAGLEFDPVSGVLSGTPQTPGRYYFTIRAKDKAHPVVVRAYILAVAGVGEVLPPHSVITTGVLPVGSGKVTGAGDLENGRRAVITATANPGFVFLNWTEGGIPRSVLRRFSFPVRANKALVANFTPAGVKVAQSITFPTLAPRTLAQARVGLKATTSSGLPVTYSVLSGPGTVEGNMLIFTGVGTISVVARQAGNTGFAAAPAVRRSVVVSN